MIVHGDIVKLTPTIRRERFNVDGDIVECKILVQFLHAMIWCPRRNDCMILLSWKQMLRGRRIVSPWTMALRAIASAEQTYKNLGQNISNIT